MQINNENTRNADEANTRADIGGAGCVPKYKGVGSGSKSWLRTVISDDKIITAIIFLNTLVIFVGGYFPRSRALMIIDAAFTLFFVLEALIKIDPWRNGWKKGWKAYWSQNWNKFDFIVVALSLPSIGEVFVGSGVQINALLALRCLRVFKLSKLFRRLPNHDNLLTGLKLAFKTSYYVIISFVLFLIVFAVLSSALFGEFAPEYFKNPGLSLYNIFKLFTVEGWYELPDAIAKNSSYAYGLFARFYFSILLFAGGIIGVSLINSVFVDAMATDNNNDVISKLEGLEKQIQRLSEQLKEANGAASSSSIDEEIDSCDGDSTSRLED